MNTACNLQYYVRLSESFKLQVEFSPAFYRLMCEEAAAAHHHACGASFSLITLQRCGLTSVFKWMGKSIHSHTNSFCLCVCLAEKPQITGWEFNAIICRFPFYRRGSEAVNLHNVIILACEHCCVAACSSLQSSDPVKGSRYNTDFQWYHSTLTASVRSLDSPVLEWSNWVYFPWINRSPLSSPSPVQISYHTCRQSQLILSSLQHLPLAVRVSIILNRHVMKATYLDPCMNKKPGTSAGFQTVYFGLNQTLGGKYVPELTPDGGLGFRLLFHVRACATQLCSTCTEVC